MQQFQKYDFLSKHDLLILVGCTMMTFFILLVFLLGHYFSVNICDAAFIRSRNPLELSLKVRHLMVRWVSLALYPANSLPSKNILHNAKMSSMHRGGSRIFFRRGAPLRNGVTDW